MVLAARHVDGGAGGSRGGIRSTAKQAWKHYAAGKYKDMEKTALRMKTLAEGPLLDTHNSRAAHYPWDAY